jgi:hypothetical protein
MAQVLKHLLNMGSTKQQQKKKVKEKAQLKIKN